MSIPARETARTRVLFCIPHLEREGPDAVFFNLLGSIDRELFEPILVVTGRTGGYLDELPDDIDVVFTDPGRYPVVSLIRIVRRLRPDVVLATLRMNTTAAAARPFFPRAHRAHLPSRQQHLWDLSLQRRSGNNLKTRAAFARLRAEHPDARLWLVGDGPDRDALQAQATDLGIRAAVDLVGFVDNPAPYVAAADLYVCSSRYEGFSNALAESVALGTPAVAPRGAGAGDEILGAGDGVLVDVATEPALLNAMTRALAADPPFDPDAIRASCRQRFSVESVARPLRGRDRRGRAPPVAGTPFLLRTVGRGLSPAVTTVGDRATGTPPGIATGAASGERRQG